MRLRKTKEKEMLIDLLLKKVYEYKKYQYQKQTKKELLAKQLQTGENIEIIKFQDWFKSEYPDQKNDVWQKEIVLEYILQYQIWAIRKNQNSKETKHIYRREAICFSKYIAHKYRVNDYRKIEDKHIASYVQSLAEQGMKASTIQKKLYAIYYYHSILMGFNNLKPIKEVMEDVKVFR